MRKKLMKELMEDYRKQRDEAAAGWEKSHALCLEMQAKLQQTERHAHWEPVYPNTPKSYTRRCSDCKRKAYMIGEEYELCPHCGAVMDGGE